MKSKLALTGAAAVGAFLVATNPVVVHAAKQVTGAGIKNNSVAGIDVKNGSLTGVDVKDGGLTGADVATNGLTGADLLDGTLTSGDLPLRVAASATENNAIQQVPVDGATALTTSMTTPAAGFLVISASSDVFGTPAAVSRCYIAVDGTEARASRRTIQLSGVEGTGTCATTMTVPVTKGSHQVELRAEAQSAAEGEDSGVTYGVASLSALFVPYGSAPVIPALDPRPGRR